MTIGSKLGEYFALTETRQFYRQVLSANNYLRECMDGTALERKERHQFLMGKMLPNVLLAVGLFTGGHLILLSEGIRALYNAFNELDRASIMQMQRIFISDGKVPPQPIRDGQTDLKQLITTLSQKRVWRRTAKADWWKNGEQFGWSGE